MQGTVLGMERGVRMGQSGLKSSRSCWADADKFVNHILLYTAETQKKKHIFFLSYHGVIPEKLTFQ